MPRSRSASRRARRAATAAVTDSSEDLHTKGEERGVRRKGAGVRGATKRRWKKTTATTIRSSWRRFPFRDVGPAHAPGGFESVLQFDASDFDVAALLVREDLLVGLAGLGRTVLGAASAGRGLLAAPALHLGPHEAHVPLHVAIGAGAPGRGEPDPVVHARAGSAKVAVRGGSAALARRASLVVPEHVGPHGAGGGAGGEASADRGDPAPAAGAPQVRRSRGAQAVAPPLGQAAVTVRLALPRVSRV